MNILHCLQSKLEIWVCNLLHMQSKWLSNLNMLSYIKHITYRPFYIASYYWTHAQFNYGYPTQLVEAKLWQDLKHPSWVKGSSSLIYCLTFINLYYFSTRYSRKIIIDTTNRYSTSTSSMTICFSSLVS